MAQDVTGNRIELGDSVYSLTRQRTGTVTGINEKLNGFNSITVRFRDGIEGISGSTSHFRSENLVVKHDNR